MEWINNNISNNPENENKEKETKPIIMNTPTGDETNQIISNINEEEKK